MCTCTTQCIHNTCVSARSGVYKVSEKYVHRTWADLEKEVNRCNVLPQEILDTWSTALMPMKGYVTVPNTLPLATICSFTSTFTYILLVWLIYLNFSLFMPINSEIVHICIYKKHNCLWSCASHKYFTRRSHIYSFKYMITHVFLVSQILFFLLSQYILKLYTHVYLYKMLIPMECWVPIILHLTAIFVQIWSNINFILLSVENCSSGHFFFFFWFYRWRILL